MVTNALRFLSLDEQAKVEQAIAAAELRTGAEIVCAVASESGRYTRSAALAGLIGVLLFLTGGTVFVHLAAYRPGSWADPPALPIGWQCLLATLSFAFGMTSSRELPRLRRLLTSRAELDSETRRGAVLTFHANGLTRTSGRGGLLLYVSLFEKTMTALADDAAMRAGGQALMDKLRDAATANLAAGKRAEALAEAVALAADALAASLPPPAEGRNELPNTLLLIHPRP